MSPQVDLLSVLAATPVLDTHIVGQLQALQRHSGRPAEEVFGELLRVFDSDGRTRLTALYDATRAGRCGDVARVSHALRGAAANTGAARLAACAAHIEDEASAGRLDPTDIDALAAAFGDGCAALRTSLLATPAI